MQQSQDDLNYQRKDNGGTINIVHPSQKYLNPDKAVQIRSKGLIYFNIGVQVK